MATRVPEADRRLGWRWAEMPAVYRDGTFRNRNDSAVADYSLEFGRDGPVAALTADQDG